MPTVTIESIEEKQTELGKLIQQFKEQSKGVTISVPSCAIELRPGERYAGARLDAQGRHLHHVIVLAARPSKKLKWVEALAWGKEVGGEVASPEEYALIKANCPDLLTEWNWTNKEHEEDASCAWYFDSDGTTLNGLRKGAAGGALAVRSV